MDIKPTALQAENYAKEQKFLEQLYTILEPGKEQECSRQLLVQLTGVDPARMHNVLLALQRAGGYTMRFEWHDPNDVTKPGKHSFWTLKMPYAEALKVLTKAQKEHTVMIKNRYKRLAAQSLASRGITYSIGDDMPKGIGIKAFSPIEKQPKALVEAARMYGPKVSAAKQAFETLTSAGIEVNEKAFFEQMSVPKDERLEAVALVLPYIDDLLSTIKQLKAERKASVSSSTGAAIKA